MISDLFRHEHPDTRSKAEWLKAVNQKIRYVAYQDMANCRVCGKQFAKKQSNQVTCNAICARINKKQAVRNWQAENYEYKKKITKNCVICGNEFQTHVSRVVCCSYLCTQQNSRNKSKKANEIRTRTNSLEGHNH